jgi:curved DNA-binding protein CbpA
MARTYLDPYEVLGVAQNASPGEIKQAYFALVRLHPPEREPEAFKQVRAAYEKLRDPQRRAEADMLLLETWQGLGRKPRQPKLDLKLHQEDVLEAARGMTDLERTDWREHHAKVEL